jgi:hypothetical protein
VCGGVLGLTLSDCRIPGLAGSPVGFALVNALVIALYTFLDGIGTRLSGSASAYSLDTPHHRGPAAPLGLGAKAGRPPGANPTTLALRPCRRSLRVRVICSRPMGHDQGAHRHRGSPPGDLHRVRSWYRFPFAEAAERDEEVIEAIQAKLDEV